MAQTSINIRMDEELKRDFNRFCDNVGLSMSAAFCVFARTCVKQRKIPFAISDISADPARIEDENWEDKLDLIDPED